MLTATAQAGGDCRWLPGEGVPGVRGHVYAVTSFDPDGPGGQSKRLVVGGNFSLAGDVFTNNIAAWDGTSWSAFDTGVAGQDGHVSALAVFDDGTGPALYAGGRFTSAGGASASNIARWDGSSWTALGPGLDGSVYALAVSGDGNGPALYAGGSFTTMGGVSAVNIAKWDGTSWSTLGAVTGSSHSTVHALTTFDDGTGPALYAGGSFTQAGGVDAHGLAKWDGSSWSAVESGGNKLPTNSGVGALTVGDDEGGPSLYAGGYFPGTAGATANRIAKWDGSTWTFLGAELNGSVRGLKVFDDGSGPALIVGGDFREAAGTRVNGIAKWDGVAWSSLATGVSESYDGRSVRAIHVFDDGSGQALYAGGRFAMAGGIAADAIAKWNGAAWSALGTGLNDWIATFTVFDDGTGPALYAGGAFTTAGGIGVNGIGKWNGTSWSALRSGTDGPVFAMTAFDDGSGPALYAGGYFTSAGGISTYGIARWDGSTWSAQETGLRGSVDAFGTFDDGNGPALYASTHYLDVGCGIASDISRWDGSTWSTVGTVASHLIVAMTAFDDGFGPAFYIGGYYESGPVEPCRFGGAPDSDEPFIHFNIAKWDGSTWSRVGTGLYGDVNDLAIFDDGNGLALYAIGNFTVVNNNQIRHVAKWDGSAWTSLGAGLDDGGLTLTVFDDGTGPALYAGGGSATAGGVSAESVAKWDGATWTSLGTGIPGTVLALQGLDDGNGPVLYAGGSFFTAGGEVSAFFARWQCDKDVCPLEEVAGGWPHRAETLETLRAFRDRVLSRTVGGRRYVKLYYEHSGEVRELIRRNAARRWRAAGLLFEFLPKVRRAMEGEAISFDAGEAGRLDAFLRDLQGAASPELARELKALRHELASGKATGVIREEKAARVVR